jgi:hypothetical protein
MTDTHRPGWIELPEGASFPPRCAACSAPSPTERVGLRAMPRKIEIVRIALAYGVAFGAVTLLDDRALQARLLPTIAIAGAATILRIEWLVRLALGRTVELPVCAACAGRERERVRQRALLRFVRGASLYALAAFLFFVRPDWSRLAQWGAWVAWFVAAGIPELLHHSRWHDWLRVERTDGRIRLRLPSAPATT